MKLLKLYLIFTLFLICRSALYAQDLEVNWHYKEEYREGFIFKLLSDKYDNSYIIYNLYRTGKNKIDSTQNYPQTDFMNTYFVKKLDKAGNELWDISINRGKSLVSPLFSVNKNGELVIGSWESTTNKQKDYVVEQYNADGIFLGRNYIIKNALYSNQCAISKIIQNDDNSLLILGGNRGNVDIVGHVDASINFEKDDAHSFIFKLKSDRSFEWIRFLTIEDKIGISNIEVDHKGNIFFAGSFEERTVTGKGIERTVDRNQLITYGKLNSEGDLLVHKHFEGVYNGYVSDLKLDNTGNVYILGSFKGQSIYFDENVKSEFYWRSTTTFLIKLNQNFDKKWLSQISLDKSIGGGRVYFGEENRILWLGSFPSEHDYDPSDQITAFQSTGSDYAGNYQTAIQSLDSEGNFLKLTLLPKDVYAAPKFLCLNNGDIIISGARQINNDKGHRLRVELNVKCLSGQFNSPKISQVRACGSYYWPETKETYTETGSYKAKYRSVKGVDSILELQLTIEKSDLSLRHDEKNIYSNAQDVTYQWLVCSDGYKPIKGEIDSVFQFRETGSYCVEVSSIYCDNVDTSACIDKEMIGIHPDDLSNYYGKDYDVLIEKIEREHVQLNSDDVEMIPFRDGPLYGFVENRKKDKWLIQPRFEQVFAVYKEGAIVKDTSRYYRYGLVDKKGKYLIPPYFPNLFKENGIYHGIISVSSDTTLHRLGDHTGHYVHYYYNENGKLLFNESAHDFESFFYEDYAWFRFGKIYYVYNKQGELEKEFKVNRDKHFIGIADNKLVFNEGDSCVVAYAIDGSVNFSIPIDSYRKTYRLGPNLFGILSSDADYFFCDSLGRNTGYSNTSGMVGMIQSDEGFFKQKQFVVQHNDYDGRGVVGLDGKQITSFNFLYVGPLINGFRYCIDTLQVPKFIDTKGKVLEIGSNLVPNILGYDRKYTLVKNYGFFEGVAIVLKRPEWSDSLAKLDQEGYRDWWYNSESFNYYDTTGKVVLTLSDTIALAGNFSDGLAPALTKDKKLGFIDRSGNWAIQPKYELAVAGAYPFPYIVVPYFSNGFAYIKSFKGYVDKDGNEYFTGKRMEDHYNFSH